MYYLYYLSISLILKAGEKKGSNGREGVVRLGRKGRHKKTVFIRKQKNEIKN